MFFANRILRSAAGTGLKETTGLFGLAVHPNPVPELKTLYLRIQHTTQRLSPASAYRRSVETVTAHRLATLEAKAGDGVAAIEAAIGGGQIEELMKQAEDEIALIQKMADWEAWKPLEADVPAGQWTSATV